MRQAFRAGRMVDVDENDNEVSHNNSNENTPLISRASTQVSSVKSRLSSSLTDERAYIRWPAQFLHTTWEVLISNYANILLVFVPLGIIAGVAGWDPVAVFVLNFLAIVPLAGLLAFATEELAAKLGQTIGGLLNATFGNAVELIVSIIALREKQIRIVQASMLGSILSNMLLVRVVSHSLHSVRLTRKQGSRLLFRRRWFRRSRTSLRCHRRANNGLPHGRRQRLPHHTRNPLRLHPRRRCP